MAIHHFRVTGKYGKPEAFKNHLFSTLLESGHGATLHITATMQLDEVAQIRGDKAECEFDFAVTEVHTGHNDNALLVGVTDIETNQWTMIHANDDEIYFTLVD